MARHWTWCKFRFKGDPRLCQQYMGEGRKYLGALESIMRDGIISSDARRITNAAGVVFHVAIAMGYPIIEIDASAISTPVEQTLGLLNGFVVTPRTAAPMNFSYDNQAVVLQSKDTAWKPYFYDASILPPTGAKMYRRDTAGQPLFEDAVLNGNVLPHANGLQLYGNVDWRNADESIIVTWAGPMSRYFLDDGVFNVYVFSHGQVVFDAGVLLTAGFFGDTSAYDSPIVRGGITFGVTGACIVTDGSLLVVVRLGFANSVTPCTEKLLHIALISGDKRKNPPPDSLLKSSIFFATPTTTTEGYGRAQVLLSNNVTLIDAQHPWFFNSTGTEARCIRYSAPDNATVQSHECVLTRASNGTWSYSDSARESSSGVSSNAAHATAKPWYTYTYTASLTLDRGTCTAPYVSHLIPDEFFNLDYGGGHFGRCIRDIITDSTSIDSLDRTAMQITSAVDYRADVPVYAYGVPPTYTDTITTSRTISQSAGASGSGSVPYVCGSPADDSTFNFTSAVNWLGSNAVSANRSYTGVTGGIITDWISVLGDETRSTTCSGSVDVNWSTSWTGAAYLSVTTYATTPSGTYSGGGSPPVSYTVTGSRAYNASGSSHTTTSRTDVNVVYLDLRYKWLVYKLRTQTSTSDVSSSFSGAAPTNSHTTYTDPIDDDLWSIPQTKLDTSSDSADFVTTLNGAELLHTIASSSSTSSTNTTPFSIQLLDTRFQFDRLTAWLLAPPAQTLEAGVVPARDPNPGTDTYSCSILWVPDGSGGYLPPTGSAYTYTWPTITNDMPVSVPPVAWWADAPAWAKISDGIGPYTLGGIPTAANPIGYNTAHGSWQFYKGAWLFSQASPSGPIATPKFATLGSNAPDVPTLTNAPGATARYFPLWVLPNVSY